MTTAAPVPYALHDPRGLDRAARRLRHLLGGGLVGITLLALAFALAVLLTRHAPSAVAVFVFGVAVLGSLALAAIRYDVLVGLGMLLLAAVQFEPAPPDFVFGVAIAVAVASGRLERVRVPTSVVALSALFIALNLLSAVEVVDAARASLYLSITFYLLVFAVWLATWVDSERKARLVSRMYVVGATATAFAAVLALFVAFPGHEFLVYDGTRAQGLFKDPNIFVSFLVPPALIVAERAVARHTSRGRRALAIGVFLVLLAGVLFSYSRAGWLNLTVGLVVLGVVLFLRRENRRLLMLAAILVAAGAIGLAAVHVSGSGDFLAQRTHLQRYDEQRFGSQLFGIEQSMRYPLGIGPGQFEVLGPIAAHSLYVRALAEHGLLGLLTLLALLLTTFALALRNALTARNTYGIGSAALLAAWCGLLANGFFIDTLHWRHLWLVAALIWAGSVSEHRHVGHDLISADRNHTEHVSAHRA
jgi:O-antigen ligase